jgi:hypothetical protein
MKIALFVFGYPRTLFYKFSDNIKIIRNNVGKCKIDVFYSLWDDLSRSERINDPWHSRAENYEIKSLSKNLVDEYFINCGANNVDGEIESIDIMQEVLDKSPFLYQKSLSSQYYKTHRVVQKYFDPSYDFYVKIRPDIIINNFPSESKILDFQNKKVLVVNEYFWYNATYNQHQVNEMICASTKDNFIEVNSLFLNQIELEKQRGGGDGCGEAVTSRYYNNLLSSNIVSSIEIFNFDYRVFR